MKFGQYELLERVAVGGMAEVYRGRVAGAEGFEKWVAIKRILPEFARDDRFISMMLTEARIHSALSHGNIVQIHDLGISEDGEYFIVLEYVEGHDLRAVMEAASELGVQIPDSLALHIADELAQALHFAHELTDAEGQPLGIIHRDVSPSNVLISNSGEVKLSDFGIAKRRHDHSVVGSLKGNLVYMSPEQAQRVTLDRRTDVFSLGAVLFEMLTGHKPREITNEMNAFRDVASGVVRSARALRPDLPEAYEALLTRALAADPADRFPDAAAFGSAIRALSRENDAPVGPADMKELVELLNPPRRARSPMERSKVIRLGPEFKALAGPARGARGGAPVGGAPVDPSGTSATSALPQQAPGMTPPEEAASKTNGNGTPAWVDRAAAYLNAGTPEPASTMALTPPPPVIAPPPASWSPGRAASASGRPGGAAALAPPIDMQATPPPPAAPEGTTPLGGGSPQSEGAYQRPTGRFPPSLARPAVTAPSSTAPYPPTPTAAPAAAPVTANQSVAAFPPPAGRPSSALDAEMAMSMPTPPPVPGAFAGFAGGLDTADTGGYPGTTAGFPAAAATPPPQNAASAPAPVVLRAGGPATRQFMPDVGPSTEVVPQPRRGRWRSVVVILLAVVSAAAVVVHYKVVPLPVAAVWMKPASLSVSSDPSGATVTLDGRELTEKTPMRIDVRRDLAEHVLELSRPGSRSVRTTMRFDRTVPLSQSITLPAEPPPPPPPPPVEAAPPPPPPAEPPPAPKKLSKAELKAEKRMAKAAAKKGSKKSAKAAAKQASKKKVKKAAKAKKAKASAAGSDSDL